MPKAQIIRQENGSFRNDIMNAGMLVSCIAGRPFLAPLLSASEARHALEQQRTIHQHSREPAQRNDALRPRN